MRILLDTHALIWWLAGDSALSRSARAAITDPANEVWVSAVSAFEVTTKFRLGKLPEAGALARDFSGECETEGFKALYVSVAHGEQAGAFVHPHRDPFDRLLIAQALAEDMTLVSKERLFDGFGVKRLCRCRKGRDHSRPFVHGNARASYSAAALLTPIFGSSSPAA